MRPEELIQQCYNQLDVSSVTELLSDEYDTVAIFQRGRVPRDDAGDAQFFPYITFHIPSDADFSDKGDLGGNAIVQIDIWDRSGSDIEVAKIMREVLLATVRDDWDIPGFITCEREGSEMMDDPDGLTKRAMIRLRILYLP